MPRQLPFLLSFLALFTTSTQAATPVILNFTQTAGIGDEIYIQGGNFGTKPTVEYAYNDQNWKVLEPLEIGTGDIIAQMPATETRLPDLLTVRVSNDGGLTWSQPVFINQSAAQYFDTDQISPHAAFQIFGINLYLGRTPTVRFLDTATGTSQQATITLAGSTNYLLKAAAPAGIQPGHTYQVYVSNGYSGNASTPAESLAAETLTGRAGGTDYWQLGAPWSADLAFYSNVYNVKTDPRLSGILAVGNGVADDTWAINHAIQVAAAAGGGVVLFPAGTYTLHIRNGCAMQLQNNVVAAGTSSGQVTINYGYPVAGPGGNGVCFANHSGLANLTLTNVDNEQHWQWSGLSQSNSEVFLKNVIWNLGTSQWVVFQNDDHIAIEDSAINQGLDSAFNNLGPLNMSSCAHCQVLRTSIRYVIGGIDLDRATDMVFQNNEVIRDISNSPAVGTVTHNIAANFVNKFAVTGNTFNAVGNGQPTNNDGEVINTEAGGNMRYDEFRGAVTSVTASSLTDRSQNFLVSPNTSPALRPQLATIAIVTGNAMGQVRQITSVSADGTTVGIDHPWDVEPEAGAHYATFDWSGKTWTIANNSMNGNFKGLEIFDASVKDILIQSNTLTNNDGIMISPSERPAGSYGALFNVIYNVRIVGNTLKDLNGLRPAYISLAPREDLQTEPFGTQVLGADVKSNSVIAAVPNTRCTNPDWDDFKVSSEGFLDIYFWQTNSPYVASAGLSPTVADIFQGNSATNSDAAFVLNSGATDTAMANTHTKAVGSTLQDLPIQRASQGSTGSIMGSQLSVFSIGPVSSATGSDPTAPTDILTPIATVDGMRAVAMGHEGAPSYTFSNGGDTFNLLGTQLTGNSIALAKAELSTGSTATGFLMMRNTATAVSPFVSIGLESNNIKIQSRSSNGGPVQTSLVPFAGTSAVLQLSKNGSLINAMYSPDGIQWITRKEIVNFPSSDYLAGVGLESNGTSNGVEVSFEGMTISPVASPLVTTGGNRPIPGRLLKTMKSVGNVVAVVWRAIWHAVRKVA